MSHEELVMRTRAAIMQVQNLHRTQTPVIVNETTLGVGQRQTPGYDQSFYQQARKYSYSKQLLEPVLLRVSPYLCHFQYLAGGEGGGLFSVYQCSDLNLGPKLWHER